MPKFTVRVELHEAKDHHYQQLHEAMEAAGFSRTINGTGGKVYQLPTAEYNYVGDVTRQTVLDRASAIAKSVKSHPLPWVLVTEGDRTWTGLERFEP